ncbi:unnamed protein product [Soboliphyme baturini]|uniref:Uncharacterized protein n=1 Tax=Soboliphyme baturini TaxID=241478 RepID=A0A183IHE8_9BILA|nr:unnamed protein product [Soboliphyme baturini]
MVHGAGKLNKNLCPGIIATSLNSQNLDNESASQNHTAGEFIVS